MCISLAACGGTDKQAAIDAFLSLIHIWWEKKPSLLEFLFCSLELVPEPIAEVRELFPHLSRIENSHPSNSGHRSQNCL